MRKTLTITSDRFLQDHCIDDHVVLPTVCAHELMRQVAQYLCVDKKVIALTNYKLYQGVVFDGFESIELLFDYSLEQVDLNTQLNIKIASHKANGAVQYHYGAELILADAVDTKANIDIASVLGNNPLNEKCLAYYQNGCLFHGPSLQGLQHVLAFDSNGLTLQIKLNNNHALAPSFTSDSHVFANDLAYQALLLWVFKQHDLNSLPTATQSWQFYQTPNDDEMILSLTIIETNQHKTIADIDWFDTKGNVIAIIKGVEVTHAKGLRDKFLKSAAKYQDIAEVAANA